MVEYFRITGLNNILFDQAAAGPPNDRYRLVRGISPTGISEPLTRQEAMGHLPKLPEEIRSHILGAPDDHEHVLSIISFPFSIQGQNDADMEDALHDLNETLQDTSLYFRTRGARGTEAILRLQTNNASQSSYKSIYYGVAREEGGREILGAAIKESYIVRLQMTLYCEPYWHPASFLGTIAGANYYNHDDAGAGHDNFLDIPAASILGDVPAKTRVDIRDDNMNGPKFFYAARRSQGTVANFDHWVEAEAMSKTNWAQVGDTDRSNGNIVSNAAAATGNIQQTVNTNLPDYKGRIGMYAGVWANDITNTYFRLSWRFGTPGPWYYGQWKRIWKASTWQLLRLGQVILDSDLYPEGDTLSQWVYRVEYKKDAADTVKCDYVMLLPEDESVFRADGAYFISLPTNYDLLEVDGQKDFPASYIVDSGTGDFYAHVALKGNYLTLQPNRINRVYFKLLNVTSGTDPWDDHFDLINDDGAPASRFYVVVYYLPQFISPLE